MSIYQKIFKHKKHKIIWKPSAHNYLIDFSIAEISSGQVIALIRHLDIAENFSHIAYNFDNGRCYLYALKRSQAMEIWFNDRNASQIEELTKSFEPITGDILTWENGFIQTVYRK